MHNWFVNEMHKSYQHAQLICTMKVLGDNLKNNLINIYECYAITAALEYNMLTC